MENDKLQLAAKLLMEDKIDMAEEILTPLYLEQPENPIVLHHLGILQLKRFKLEEGIKLLQTAIEKKADYLDPYFNLSVVYIANKDYQKAIQINLKALEFNKQAITAYSNLAQIYKELNNIDKSIEISLKALKIQPFNLTILYNLAFYYYEQNKIDEAIDCYLRITIVNPNYNFTYFNLATCYKIKKDEEKAKIYFEKDFALRPNTKETFNKLCNLYLADDEKISVEKIASQFIDNNPNLPDGYFALGTALMDSDPDSAMKEFQKAIELDNNFFRAYCNIGMIYRNKNDLASTIQYFKKAVEIAPEFPEATTNLAYSYLASKNFEVGWEFHESRFFTENFKKYDFKLPSSGKPFWNGEDIDNKTIYVYYEQGLGDTINFSRYFNLLKEANANILFKSQPHLISFLEQNYPYISYYNYDIDESTLAYDYHIALMSLPKAFKTNVNNIPFPNKYMSANAVIAKSYKDQFFNNDDFKIGICWRGGTNNMMDKARSIALKNFFMLSKIPNVKFYSLQKYTGLDELNNLPSDFNVENIGVTFKDFSYTAAAIENMDLVITVDTSVGHVAGALGKPVWLLLLYNCDWRWFSEGEKTPWYSGHKLFRQSETRDWDEVFDKIYKNLFSIMNI